MSDNGEFIHTFVIGNVIHNIHRTVSDNGPGDPWGPSALMMSGGHERHVINNTIYNVDSGVNIATGVGSIEIADNIIANVTIPGNSHVLIGYPALAANTSFHHNLLFGNPRINYGNGQMYPSPTQLALAQSLSSDPQFLNAAAGDFHTAATSPAANRAEFNSAHATFLQRYGLSIAFDADGNVRPQSATTDMGAYLSAGSLNQAPTISAIGAVATSEDTSTGALAFTVGDVETSSASLTVSGGSTNTALVPNANLAFGGSGAARTVTVTPAANMFGTTLISLTVSDGNKTTTTIFLLTVNAVNDMPTISGIANQMTTVNLAKGPIAFTVSDIETSAASLAVSASSSNPTLVPTTNITFGGSGANRTMTFVPTTNRTGVATITVTVSDGGLMSTTTFNAIVPGKGDFDGDGRADVILRNKVDRPEHRLADERADGWQLRRSCRRSPTRTGRSRASATSTATARPTSSAQQVNGPEHRLADERADRLPLGVPADDRRHELGDRGRRRLQRRRQGRRPLAQQDRPARTSAG